MFAKYFVAIFIGLIGNFQLQAQKQFWDAKFIEVAPRQAIYYSLPTDNGNHWIQTYYYLRNHVKVKELYINALTRKQIKEIEYHQNGQKKSDLTPSLLKKWYADGQLKQEIPLNNRGLIHGLYESYYQNGQKMFRHTYEEGKMIGQQYNWYENGQLKSVELKEKGERTINYTYWHENGQISMKSDSLLENGLLGYFNIDSTGRVAETATWKNGKLDGLHQYWYKSGQLAASGMTKKGKRIGTWEIFSHQGELIYSLDCQKAPDSLLKDHIGYHIFHQLLSVEDALSINWKMSDKMFMCLESEPITPEVLNMQEVQHQIGYPPIAIHRNIQGQVIVRVLINEEGIPISHKLIQSPHVLLDNAVLTRIYELAFIPGMECGKAVHYWMEIPFSFSLYP